MALFQGAIFDEIEKMSIFSNFVWHFLPHHFCKPALENLTILETLLFCEVYMIPKNDENGMIFALKAPPLER